MTSMLALCLTLLASSLTTSDGCTQGFPTTETVNSLAEECTMTGQCGTRNSPSTDGSIYVIPTMNFTCNGRIMSWTVGGFLHHGGQSGDARLLILRPSSSTLLSAVTTLSSLLVCNEEMLASNSDNVYECRLNDTVTVQPGDVLGIRLPRGDEPSINTLAVHFSTSGNAMPVHNIYIIRGNMNLNSLDLTSSDVLTQQALPLIALEVARNGNGPTEDNDNGVGTAQPETTANEESGTGTTTGGNTDMTNDIPTPLRQTSNPDVSTGVGGTDTPQITTNIRTMTTELNPSISPRDATIPIVGVVVGVAVVLVLGAAVTTVLIVLHKKSKPFKKSSSKRKGSTFSTEELMPHAVVALEMQAQEYSEIQSTRKNTGIYATPEVGHHEPELITQYEQIGVAARAYETPVTSAKFKESASTTTISLVEEDIYAVPAKEEDHLYQQLLDFRTKILQRNSVVLGERLGSGQFGVVFEGLLQEKGGRRIEVAVKTLTEGSGNEERVKFLQEAAIMTQFRHSNVVKICGVVRDGEPLLLVLELLKKGDLRKNLTDMKSDETADGHTLLSYCRQVASGMTYLSSKAFIHRDLAARNILLSEDGSCKIADFGMSRDLTDENYYVSQGGKIPVKWTAPEALEYKKYSTASDVWSYGVLMYEIWSLGQTPFQGLSNLETVRQVSSGYRLPPPPGCPRSLYSIMISCWHPAPSKRPAFPLLCQQLSLPDTKLLQWSREDWAVHPEAAKLGAHLISAQDLYKDLQSMYVTTTDDTNT